MAYLSHNYGYLRKKLDKSLGGDYTPNSAPFKVVEALLKNKFTNTIMVTQTAFLALSGSMLLIAVAVLLLNWGLDRTRRDVKKLTGKK